MDTEATREGARCGICEEPIGAGERVTDDGAEVAHEACVRGWFRRNFGREGLS